MWKSIHRLLEEIQVREVQKARRSGEIHQEDMQRWEENAAASAAKSWKNFAKEDNERL